MTTLLLMTCYNSLSIERQFCDIVVIYEYPVIDDMMILLYFKTQFCDRVVLHEYLAIDDMVMLLCCLLEESFVIFLDICKEYL
jgi:hypothetical protein